MFESPGKLLLAQKLHPLELASALERHMEDKAKPLVDRQAVPNVFTLYLNPTDYQEVAPVRHALEQDLVDRVAEVISNRGYRLVGPLRVAVQADPSVERGQLRIESAFAEADKTWPVQQARDPLVSARPRWPEQGTTRSGPAVEGPARLRLQRSGSPMQTWSLTKLPCTLGRAVDNDVQLSDLRVSRHHARIEWTEQGLLITDLGSSNGTRVNGQAVHTSLIRPGDQIELGGVILSLEREN